MTEREPVETTNLDRYGFPALPWSLVFDGRGSRTTDPATLESVVKRYNAAGWPAEVEGDAFTAPFSVPSAGPPPWLLYRFHIRQGSWRCHGRALRRDALAVQQLTITTSAPSLTPGR